MPIKMEGGGHFWKTLVHEKTSAHGRTSPSNPVRGTGHIVINQTDPVFLL